MSGSSETPETLPSQFSNSINLHPALSSYYPITLKFIDVRYRVKDERSKKSRTCSIRNIFTVNCESHDDDIEAPSTMTGNNSTPTHQQVEERDIEREREGRTILNGITGMVSPGEMLAVLGPSGSGKSTLLNAIAGRLHNNHQITGTVLANNKKLTKPVLKRTGFVPQEDVLYPHLTVRETLIFCALLRLPNAISKQEKLSMVDKVIYELGLEKCEDTVVGNGTFIRGVSGGERKRVSIAHEMLINPSLLILDEPTSGLDSTAAYRMVSTLGVLAHQKGKTVVTSVHQPSSRVYQMFDSVLVLSEGSCLYFGKANEAMSYFDSLGFSPTFPMNPADFLLDLANGVCQMENGTNECKEKNNVKQVLVSSYNSLLAPRVKAACTDSTSYCSSNSHLTNSLDISSSRRSSKMSCGSKISAWFNQYSILIQRGIKERRHETFNSLRVFQVLAASLLAGSMWWHSDFRDIQDRLGLLFVMSIFWGVFPSFNAVFAFPQERAIFNKERSSGMYTLSSYFMARITGELPMELILPTVFLTITYWMAGLKPDLWAFFQTLMVMLGYALVSQGLGLSLGALIMDAKKASTVVTVTMLAFVLTGGFYVHKLPSCISWIKYISTTFYCYRLLIDVQYGDGEAITSFLGCSRYHQGHAISDQPISCRFIEEDIVGQIHPTVSVGAFLIMFVGYRLIAYLAMRRMTS